MHSKLLSGMTSGMVAILLTTAPAARAQSQPAAAPAPAPQAADDNDPVRMLVGRLDLEKYKATIKGLTQFGDRRQGTDRNRAAIDWIEAQLKSYGCTNTERVKYDYQPPAGRGTAPAQRLAAGTGRRRWTRRGRGGRRRPARWRARTRGSGRQHHLRHSRAHGRQQQSQRPDRPQAARAQLAAEHAWPARAGLLHQGRHDPSRRDVHRRRSHGRHRVWRSRQRRRLRDRVW